VLFRSEQHWNSILLALELDYKLWLAKILEAQYLKNYKFSGEYETTKTRIINWRKGFFAHFNLKNLREYENFREKNKLDNESIRSLFYKIAEIADQYNKGKITSNLKESFEQVEKETSEECNKWLENFKQI
jgi:hypothetical protein